MCSQPMDCGSVDWKQDAEVASQQRARKPKEAST